MSNIQRMETLVNNVLISSSVPHNPWEYKSLIELATVSLACPTLDEPERKSQTE